MQNDERRLGGDATDAAPTTAVTHRYNLLGQRVSTDVTADGKPAEPLARYHYNADGSVAETALGPDGLPRRYRYDPLGELTQIADPAMTETLGYKLPGDQGHGDGNITQAAYDLHYTDGVSHTYAYSYDPHDRLTAAHNDQAQLAGSSLEAVTYDPNGNIQTERRGDGQTRTYAFAPKANRVATVTGDGVNAHYAYDAKGRMAGASGDGAPDVQSLDYDPLNNLPRHVSGADELEVDYHYDVHNRRVAKIGHRADGADTARAYYRGQGATALTELAGDAAALKPQTYLRGPGGLQAVELQGQRYFVSHDHLGSTRALMDTTGKVAAYFNYTPFGELMPGNSQDDGGLAAHMPYRFAGTEYDAETGLYNNRARWYDPALGRFLTPDPDHQYPSPYVYVGNNPVNGVDPTGMFNPLAEAGIGAEIPDEDIGGGGGGDDRYPRRGDKGKEKDPIQRDDSDEDDEETLSLEDEPEKKTNPNVRRKRIYGEYQGHPLSEAGFGALAGDVDDIEILPDPELPEDISAFRQLYSMNHEHWLDIQEIMGMLRNKIEVEFGRSLSRIESEIFLRCVYVLFKSTRGSPLHGATYPGSLSFWIGVDHGEEYLLKAQKTYLFKLTADLLYSYWSYYNVYGYGMKIIRAAWFFGPYRG